MGGRVIVVGSVNIDLVVTVPELPGAGQTVIGGRFAQHHGGKGGNQAVAAARLGATTAFVGAVGGDAFGHAARSALEAEGIDVRGLVVLNGEATGVALIQVGADGENRIAVASGANAALTVAHVRSALEALAPAPGDVVLVGHEIPTAATREALRLGRRAKATTILNPAPAGDLSRTILALADIVTPNRGELAVIADDDGPSAGAAAAAVLGGAARRAVFVSLGADGALLVRSTGTVPVRAPRVDAIDTVGAGDTLNGALAAGLAAGLELEDAAHRAVAAASLAVTRAGAREGMPTAAGLEAFLR